MSDELLDEARATIERWAGDLDDAGPEFQTLHMLASYLLAIADRALPKIDADERSKILRAAALEGENAESLVKLGNEIVQDALYTARRIGQTEPDDTMVICPVCTSQFRAIPLDVQRQLAFLSAPERGERSSEDDE